MLPIKENPTIIYYLLTVGAVGFELIKWSIFILKQFSGELFGNTFLIKKNRKKSNSLVNEK